MIDLYLRKLCDQLHEENTEKLRDVIAPPFTVEQVRLGQKVLDAAKSVYTSPKIPMMSKEEE